MDRDFLKGQYEFEIERKDALTNAMAVPVGVLTVLGGLLGFLSRDFSYRPAYLSWIFVALLVIDALLFLVSVILLLCAYHGYAYSFLPTASELASYYEQLCTYLKQTKSQEEVDKVAEDRAKSQLDAMLIRRYTEAITVNSGNNDKKSAYLHRSNTFLIAALAAALIAVIPFTIDSKTKQKEVQEVRIVNLPVQTLQKEDKNGLNSGTKTHRPPTDNAHQPSRPNASGSPASGTPKPQNKGLRNRP
jgi:hypothetical protein